MQHLIEKKGNQICFSKVQVKTCTPRQPELRTEQVSFTCMDEHKAETFERRAKAKFSAEMWTDADDLERKIYKSKKKVAGWTTNGKEVAYYIEEDIVEDKMPNK